MPAGLFCCMMSVWRVRASQIARVAGKNLAGEPKKICVGLAPRVRRQLRFTAGLRQEMFGGETGGNGGPRAEEAPPASLRKLGDLDRNFAFLRAGGPPRQK